ncbi:Hypothetical protein, predicted lipoprotein [Mycoplasmopsis agalactiae 14628]|uniref:DUF31 domain-containing protein n=1 Tax=Mycoplasmopsis agalactiae 14628 TaxID=1110504 RepID=I5D5X7_MYCAA|nr:DUF31 family protein [Mycoplasmopsis agalactiae]EIN15086.1 Hypothetical protein, predicted lipoprotein [Mycoplasmopsis agalactiae 14628]
MKKLKKTLLLCSSSSLLPALLIAAKCTNDSKKDSKDEKKITLLSDSEFEKLVNETNDLNDLASLSFNSNFGPGKSLDKTLPTEIEENPGSLKISVKDKYSESIIVKVQGASTEKDAHRNISNIKGEVSVYVGFTNKSTSKEIYKNFTLKNLANNPVGADHNGRLSGDPLAAVGGQQGYLDYHKKTQAERFKKDNNEYVNQLKGMLSRGTGKQVDFKSFRGLTTTDEQIKKFNETAKLVNFDSYENAALKGFTVPVYENGKASLKVYDAPEMSKGPSPIDTIGRNIYRSSGLARTLLNETYKTIAEQTFQVSFTTLKDFDEEIKQAENLKNQITSWNRDQINSFTAKDRANLKANYETDVYQLELERKSLSAEALKGLEKSFQERRKKLEDDFQKENSRLENITNEELKKEIEKHIENYKQLKSEGRTYSSVSGTMWIMDFMMPENGKGATKFYFGTNSHVAKGLTDKTTKFSMSRMNENVGVGSHFRLNDLDDRFTRFLFDNVDKDAINVIFQATDFLDSKPSEFLESSQKEKFKGVEEFMDFAVIEIDFEKILKNKNDNFSAISNRKNLTSTYSSKSTEDIVKLITNNYQSKTDKHVKFRADSYLKDYSKIDRPIILDTKKADEVKKFNNLDSLYILGYPSSTGDYFLENYIDEDQQKEVKTNFSMWINADDKYYKNVAAQEGAPSNHSKENLERGEFLSYEIGYRSFTDKPGLTDGFIAASRTGNDLYSINGKQYFNYGLHIMPRSYVPSGGASGSSVRNKKNELIAVFHTANNSAKTGLAAAFRSYGYDYQGLFGEYKLPAYDLIYGGAAGQKNSYRDALEKRYPKNGKEHKTNLFKSGFSKDQIPEEFKFNESTSSSTTSR